jgi:hypothetical protein
MASRDGLPFLEHVATVTSTGIDKTSFQGTIVLATSRPIKGEAGAPQGDRQQATHRIEINISSNHLVLSFSSL